jgi:hypothetical protein
MTPTNARTRSSLPRYIETGKYIRNANGNDEKNGKINFDKISSGKYTPLENSTIQSNRKRGPMDSLVQKASMETK